MVYPRGTTQKKQTQHISVQGCVLRMSSSFSIEISEDENEVNEQSNSSSIASAEADLAPSDPPASGQLNQWQNTGQDAEGAGATSEGSLAGRFAAASQCVETHRPTAGDAAASTQQQQLQQQQRQQQVSEARSSIEPRQSIRDDVPSSAPQSGEGLPALEHVGSGPSAHPSPLKQQQTPPQQQWNRTSSSHSQREGTLPAESLSDVPRSTNAPALANSLRAFASTVGPPRIASSGQPYEGILKRRTENSAAQSTMGDDVVIGSKNKLWLAPGSVLWRLVCCALALRIGSSLSLLVVVLTTLGRMGKAVTCVDMSKCLGGGGIMAIPILLRTQPNFGAGIVAYETITEALVAGLVLILVPTVGSCYYTCQALLKGTKKAYLDDVRVTTCCTAWVGACVGAFIPPAFFTEQFCDPANFDVNSVYRAADSPAAAVSRNMCDQVGLSRACIGVALLCACSAGLLLFQRYSRLWASLLGLGCLKFVFAGFLLCFTVMSGGQSNEMMLETMDEYNRPSTPLAGLSRPMLVQLGLLFASLKWGGFILALSNLACGAFTIWAAHLRSHLLSCTNLVVNFVFFFVNAVSFFAMLFEFTTLQMICNYDTFPMSQSERARAEAAFICTIRPQFIFMWFLVALSALIHLIEFIISAMLFQREFCRARPKAGSMLSAPSIDSLPPKWGVKR